MGYALTTLPVRYVKKGVAEAIPIFVGSNLKVDTTYYIIFSAMLDITAIDDFCYHGNVAGAQNITLRFRIDGSNTDKTLTNSTQNRGTMDVSSITGEKSVIIYIRAGAGTILTDLTINALVTI